MSSNVDGAAPLAPFYLNARSLKIATKSLTQSSQGWFNLADWTRHFNSTPGFELVM